MKEVQLHHEIIASFRQGDELAFRTIHRQYFHSLCHFANQLIDNVPEAQDIVAESFVKLWINREQSLTLQGIKGFLYLTTKNACRNFLRNKKRKTDSEKEILYLMEVQEESILTIMVKTELHSEIRILMEQLPFKPGKVIKELFLSEKKTKDVSQALNMPEENVLNNKSRGLKRLRESIEKYKLLPTAAIVFSLLHFLTFFKH